MKNLQCLLASLGFLMILVAPGVGQEEFAAPAGEGDAPIGGAPLE